MGWADWAKLGFESYDVYQNKKITLKQLNHQILQQFVVVLAQQNWA